LKLLSNNQLPIKYKLIEISGICWHGYNLEKIVKLLYENICNYNETICVTFKNPGARFYLLDLYNMEINKLVSKGITMSVVNDLRGVFMKKDSLNENKYFTINVYIRQGDLSKLGMVFEYNIIKYIDKYLTNNEKYKINLISAGTKKQMNKILENFKEFKNINFVLNKPEKEVFVKMVNSDLLIFNSSSFPFTASLYCKGTIIMSKQNKTYGRNYYYKDEIFLDNYILINEKGTKLNHFDNDFIKIFSGL